MKLLKPITPKKPIVRDPAKFPKVQLPLENEVKQSYNLQLNKMVVDLTKFLSKI